MRLIGIRYAARDIAVYEFATLDDGPLPEAEPGAHIDVILPNSMTRQYSIINPEKSPTSYVIGVKRDVKGRGASRFISDVLRVGEVVKIAGPRNHFPLVHTSKEVVLIAGGIGITPIWSMIQRLQQGPNPWTLHYCCRSRADAAFLAELQGMGSTRFYFDDENGGRPPDIGVMVADAPQGAHLYCCGPAPMLAAFEKATVDRPSGQIHVEYFTPKDTPALGGHFVVELARTGKEFPIPEGKTILEVLLEAGISVPFSCEQGVCGSCETRIISGIPDHRDSLLSESERQSQKMMMICCSGSKSDRLVLDL